MNKIIPWVLATTALLALLITGYYWQVLSAKPQYSSLTSATNEGNTVISTTTVESDQLTEPIMVESTGLGKINLRDLELVVRESSGQSSMARVDKARLYILKDFTVPVYLADNNNVYVYDSANVDNWNNQSNSRVLTRLPLGPTTFRIINYYFIADDKQVLYSDWWGGRYAFLPVEGIDVKTARSGVAQDSAVERINSAGRDDHIIIDDNNVFLGKNMLTSNKNFHFLNWRSGNNLYATIYAISGDKVICLSENRTGSLVTVIGNILSADSNTFIPFLISGQLNYAKDALGNAFVDCTALPKISDHPIKNLTARSLFHDNTVAALVLESDDAIYSKEGSILVVRDRAIQNSFRFLDKIGNYFALDGKVYWNNTALDEKSKVSVLNKGDVDLDTFMVMSSGKTWYESFGIAKDKFRVYLRDNIVFIPKDTPSLTMVSCPSDKLFLKDNFAVYAADGTIVQDVVPNSFENDPRCSEIHTEDGF